MATGSLVFEISMQRYNKKMRPAKLGLIYAVKCSKVQPIAEKVQKKVQPIAALSVAFLGELPVLKRQVVVLIEQVVQFG